MRFKSSLILLIVLLFVGGLAGTALSVGLRGGGGGGGRGGGGGGRPAVSRPAARPAPRPQVNRGPTMSRPQPSRPAPRPAPRPSPSRPSRPSTQPSRPNVGGGNRPSGGVNRPSGGVNRPGNIAGGGSRPGVGGGGARPGISDMRPSARPSPGDLAGFLNMPGEGAGGGFPGMGEGRPSTLPATRPGAGGGGEQRPGFRPDGGGNRPGAGGDRPGAGGGGEQRPGFRPDGGGDRPVRPGGGGSGEQRPGFRPDGGGGQRPNFRPSTGNNPRDRFENRQDWANNIRNNWHDHDNNFWNDFHNDFNHPGWCNDYPHLGAGYWNCHNHYAYGWWTWATPLALTGWWAGSGWSEPVYYDYGTGGNVYYQDDNVYVNGQQTASAEDYAAQAQQLAANGAAQLEQAPPAGAEEQWMPLGMFAVSTSKEDESPLFVMQMAVNKKGVINGTMYNLVTKSSKPILGSVDPKTQRACWYVGDKPETVAETGIYNLTKDQTSVLVHFGQDKTEEYMLVRLPPPAESKSKSASVDRGAHPEPASHKRRGEENRNV